MATQLLFYSRAVPVAPSLHADVSVKVGDDYGFTRQANSVPVTLSEIPRASNEFAVVFAGEGDNIMPVALLGVQAEHNLFVNDVGHWRGRYVPAYIRRYPFVFSTSDDGATFTLCINEDFAGCNREGRGERLFDADGERTQYLESTLNFVREYQVQIHRARTFCARLHELDLLEPMQAQFTLGDEQPRRLTGFMAVSREKLKALGDDVLADMVRRDELEVIYLHLRSMQNFSTMVESAGGAHETAATSATTGEDLAAAPTDTQSRQDAATD